MAISLVEKEDRKQYGDYYKELEINTYKSFLNEDFSWACDQCLRSGKAVTANPSAQFYSWHPHYAYFDTQHICRTSKVKFIFGKEEKRYWFETLKFWTESKPVNSPECRKELRELKAENKLLSDLLRKDEKELSAEELEQIIEIYSKWDKIEKAKYFASVLRKTKKI